MVSKKYTYSYAGADILLSDINILPQPRKTFEHIEELSLDIKKKGILNPPTVAFFGLKSAKNYIDTVNLLWKTGFSLSDLHVMGKGSKRKYYVLLAGERRVRACKLLWDNAPRKKNQCSFV